MLKKLFKKLSRGDRVNLSKEEPGLANVYIGMGWDVLRADGENDLDVSVLMLDKSDKAINDKSFIYYNKHTSECGSIQYQGDNLTGEGDDDDEAVTIDLKKVPESVHKLLVSVSIHEAKEKNQNFGVVNHAFVRLVDEADGKEMVRYDLTEDFSNQATIIFGELYRKEDGDWRFAAKGDGFAGGLEALLMAYGISSETSEA